MSRPHLFALRVYYEDTDFSGYTYHANYLKFLERGRTEFLRALSIVQSDLYRDADGLAFVVSHMAVDFRKPALMDDELVIATTLTTLQGARMILRQDVLRGGDGLVSADVTIAAVRRGRAVRLPEALRHALTGLV